MFENNEDYYKVLKVSRDASESTIKSAYRSLARKLHPDVNKKANAQEEFSKLQKAYDTLSDPKKKTLYDRGGPGAVGGNHRNWSNGPIPGLDEIFNEMFKNNTQSPQTSSTKGPDRRMELQITFMTAALGGTEEVLDNSGKRISLKIPAGVEQGQELRVRQHGDLSQNGSLPGDLLVRVKVGDHPWFKREGFDILFQLPINFIEAIKGCNLLIPHLRGKVELRIPPGTSSGTRMRLSNFGIENKNGKKGDYLVEIKIIVPKNLSPSVNDLLKKISNELDNPRKKFEWSEDE